MNWWFAKKTTTASIAATRPAEVFLPFQFHVEEAMDVCPEFEQGAHHFTHLFGHVTQGTIKSNQPIAVPLKGGIVCASRVQLLSTDHRIVDDISSEYSGRVTISIAGCSIRYDEVEPGAMIEWYSSEAQVDLAMRFRAQPSLYLHRTSGTHSLCTFCNDALFSIPGCSSILTDLTSHADPDIAEMARIALDSFSRL
jgi:hypothetical protein